MSWTVSQYTEEGRRIWEEFGKEYEHVAVISYPILGEAYTLFSQAVSAFKAAVDFGTVILCRDCLESAFFLFLTRTWKINGILTEYPKTLDGKNRKLYFPELFRAIKKKIDFTTQQEAAIRRIQE